VFTKLATGLNLRFPNHAFVQFCELVSASKYGGEKLFSV